ncbi:MAG: autotransporter assembly complex family protein [Albidovulum sp.]
MQSGRTGIVKSSVLALSCAVVAFLASPGRALNSLSINVQGARDDLTDALTAASLLKQAEREGTTDSQSLFAAARADYARLLGALYAEGYYSGVIRIRIDGQEAANIAPLDAPRTISTIKVTVKPGPRFTFGKARMKPYAKGTKLPPAYGDTKPAYSTAIVEAAEAGVEGWRNVGHAKAQVSGQKIVADHRSATLSSEILLSPGPRVRFGDLNVTGNERMRLERIRKIAGFPTGEVFDPSEMETVAKRLRRTGVFRSVALTEAETLGPGDTLDVDLALAEEALRRFGFGIEASTSDGMNLSGYWLHRNLLGGAERLRVDAAIDRIGAQDTDLGYSLGVRIDRPATPVTDATAFIEARAERTEVVDQTVDSLKLSFGLTRVLSDRLTAEAGIAYIHSTAKDAAGSTDFDLFALPLSLTWDDRDNPTDARKGYYLDLDATPFLGLNTTGSGGQIKADARAYRSLGGSGRVVLAGRFQLGTVVGPDLADTPPDFLFFSGGGGSVRGQPFQSLGVPVMKSPTLTIQSGGMSFVGFSGEIRAGITEKIGAVAFYDAGFVSDEGLWGGTGEWHSGAGLGLRYDTGIGPIRLDVGLPVSGGTGDGVQIYVGIGQAF